MYKVNFDGNKVIYDFDRNRLYLDISGHTYAKDLHFNLYDVWKENTNVEVHITGYGLDLVFDKTYMLSVYYDDKGISAVSFSLGVKKEYLDNNVF